MRRSSRAARPSPSPSPAVSGLPRRLRLRRRRWPPLKDGSAGRMSSTSTRCRGSSLRGCTCGRPGAKPYRCVKKAPSCGIMDLEMFSTTMAASTARLTAARKAQCLQPYLSGPHASGATHSRSLTVTPSAESSSSFGFAAWPIRRLSIANARTFWRCSMPQSRVLVSLSRVSVRAFFLSLSTVSPKCRATSPSRASMSPLACASFTSLALSASVRSCRCSSSAFICARHES
mmetsp:Transcript_48982/g.93622  ORF Transcript_48982/g.93622 Transcript_48982/m.93622 type:complete len:231 (-) Transcript_48982:801-1493(-)